MGCATVPVPFTGEHTVKGKSENFKMTGKRAAQGPVCLRLALACEAGPRGCPSPSLPLETVGSTAVPNGMSAAWSPLAAAGAGDLPLPRTIAFA